ncbi:MAG: hypothetical protein ACOCP8_01800 [archaeon]
MKNLNVNPNLLVKARQLLDEEIKNGLLQNNYSKRRELIIALCLQYDFKWKFIGNIVYINSIIDQWYFDYTKQRKISLWHKNRLYCIDQYHFQKKFTNLQSVIRYIYKHDNYYYKYRKTKIDRLFDELHEK